MQSYLGGSITRGWQIFRPGNSAYLPRHISLLYLQSSVNREGNGLRWRKLFAVDCVPLVNVGIPRGWRYHAKCRIGKYLAIVWEIDFREEFRGNKDTFLEKVERKIEHFNSSCYCQHSCSTRDRKPKLYRRKQKIEFLVTVKILKSYKLRDEACFVPRSVRASVWSRDVGSLEARRSRHQASRWFH